MSTSLTVPARPAVPLVRAQLRLGAMGYEGARVDLPSLRKWNPGAGSADSDILRDLPSLRGRARDLSRNNPLATGAISTVVANAVGTGLAVQAQIDREYLGLSEEQAADWARQAERLFWACADSLDIERTSNFLGLQDLVMRSTLDSGDVFTLRRYQPYPGDLIGLKLQMVEADRVCNPHYLPDSRDIAGGIERDRNGAPVACHVLDTHPGDFFTFAQVQEWKRLLVFDRFGRRQVLHHFRKRRPGATRGVPYFAPVIEHILQLGRYTKAEVEAAVINSFFTVFTTLPASATSPGLQTVEEDPTTDVDTELELASGTEVELGPGEDVKFADPKRPNVNFGAFSEAILKQVAVGLEMPYEVLMKHFNSSYSAARAALLDAWRFFLNWRVWLRDTFCQPVYEMVIAECVAREMISAPGFFTDPLARRAWLNTEWVGDAAGQIDPLKEAKAMETRLALGVTTLQEETSAYSGKDWQRNHEQRTKEVAARKEAGLETEATPAAGDTEPDPDSEEEES